MSVSALCNKSSSLGKVLHNLDYFRKHFKDLATRAAAVALANTIPVSPRNAILSPTGSLTLRRKTALPSPVQQMSFFVSPNNTSAPTSASPLAPPLSPSQPAAASPTPLSPSQYSSSSSLMASWSTSNFLNAGDRSPASKSQHTHTMVADVTNLEADIETKEELKYNPELERMARKWIIDVVGDECAESNSIAFAEWLKSGTILCR